VIAWGSRMHLGQLLATEVSPILVRKLANGEIYLLLAGTWSAEGYTQDLHLCSTGTRTIRFTAHLARSWPFRRLGEGTSYQDLLDRLF
jgi:hypothetical protein